MKISKYLASNFTVDGKQKGSLPPGRDRGLVCVWTNEVLEDCEGKIRHCVQLTEIDGLRQEQGQQRGRKVELLMMFH